MNPKEIYVECPHCQKTILIMSNEINCAIFRHGAYKHNLKQINPHEKKEICDKNKVNIMIDGKLQVFDDFSDLIFKIWLCDDSKKISGGKKFTPEKIAKVSICANWLEVVDTIQQKLKLTIG